ncbi:MAG: trypsin-like peptidase domain-containing protein [Alphaproteobacteria bacterium]|nr:trypsin-like peptidase domain-containing protein [Alphaproteobacteria bacterium]MCB9794586.1 trypsin-like peptidase domain-containing protein [Alphaproteobacteria bacterium]
MRAPLLITLALWPTGGLHPVSTLEDPVVREVAHALVSFPGATGFFISPEGHLLTNAHVAARFGEAGAVVLDPLDPEPAWVELVLVSERFDLALYKAEVVAPTPWVPLCGVAPELGQVVAVVGHLDRPLARASFGRLLAVDSAPDGRPAIEYTAPTLWGSSGSPVIDEQGRAIGMHRAWDADGRSQGALVGVPLCQALEELEGLRAVVPP